MPKPPVTDLNVSSRRYSGWSVSGRRKKAQRLISVARPAGEHEDRLPRAGEQQYLADAGGDDGHGHEDHEDQRHDRLGHVAAREAVADDGGRDHAVAAAPRPCVKRRARRDCEIRREGRGEGADDIDAQPEQQRDAAAEAVGQRPEDELREAEAEHVGATTSCRSFSCEMPRASPI